MTVCGKDRPLYIKYISIQKRHVSVYLSDLFQINDRHQTRRIDYYFPQPVYLFLTLRSLYVHRGQQPNGW